MNLCPCNSHLPYQQCCRLYLVKGCLPPSPEALMRSRYTAYTKAKIAYIKKTMCGPSLINFDEESARQWAEASQWLGLTVLTALPVEKGETVGFVEFIANYQLNSVLQSVSERSEFRFINGRWYYFDGKHLPG